MLKFIFSSIFLCENSDFLRFKKIMDDSTRVDIVKTGENEETSMLTEKDENTRNTGTKIAFIKLFSLIIDVLNGVKYKILTSMFTLKQSAVCLHKNFTR